MPTFFECLDKLETKFTTCTPQASHRHVRAPWHALGLAVALGDGVVHDLPSVAHDLPIDIIVPYDLPNCGDS
eukprot:34867-Amphidinium_carterae.1